MNKSKCFSVQLEISLNFEIQNRILKKFLVNFLTISGSFKDFSGFFFTKKWGGAHFFLVGILIFLLVRCPRKISEPYDNPFWEKSLWWVVVVCKPILVFSFDFSQAEQLCVNN